MYMYNGLLDARNILKHSLIDQFFFLIDESNM